MKKNVTRNIAVFGAISIVGLVVILSAINIAFGQSKGFDLTNEPNTANTEGINTANGGVQIVKLSQSNGVNYVMEPATLKQGVPVRMEVDMNTVLGCMRTIVIPSVGVRQSVSEGNNIIQFTPQKSGTFQITCGMGMGRGTFTVAAADGSVAATIEKQSTGGSCGATGGGCGCGGARAN